MPTSTSNSPFLRRWSIATRSIASMSLCRYSTRIPSLWRYCERSSAERFVSVVTNTRSFCATTFPISATRSSIWFASGRISITGSRSPVGRITCSATVFDCSYS